MAPKRETALDAWGKELAHACDAAGMTGRQLAEALHVAPSTISQWMNGRRTPHIEDVERCDQALATNGYLARYFERWVTREMPTVWTETWLAAEAHANMIENFEISVIPGLLQTEEYAHAVLRFSRHPSIDVDEFLRRRMERQAILVDENPPLCVFVIDEYALRRTVGDREVMSRQLSRLRELATWPNIVIKVIPFGAEYYPGCPFMIARLDGAVVANLDSVLDAQVVEGYEDIAEITRVWEDIREVALSAKESLELIERALETWETGSGESRPTAEPTASSALRSPSSMAFGVGGDRAAGSIAR